MERGVNRLLYLVRGETGGRCGFRSSCGGPRHEMHKGPPQPMNVILTDMDTKNACKNPVKASAFDVGGVRTTPGLEGLMVRD